MLRVLFIATLTCWIATSARAEELVLAPAETTLTGPQAAQRVVVFAKDGGYCVGDRTAAATFSSSNPAVATVDDAGCVRAVGDGEALITAVVSGQKATGRVH